MEELDDACLESFDQDRQKSMCGCPAYQDAGTIAVTLEEKVWRRDYLYTGDDPLHPGQELKRKGIVLFNPSNKDRAVVVCNQTSTAGCHFYDVMNQHEIMVIDYGPLEVTIPARLGMILVECPNGGCR